MQRRLEQAGRAPDSAADPAEGTPPPARELGATIVTLNTADFGLIGRHVDINLVEPWPRQPAA